MMTLPAAQRRGHLPILEAIGTVMILAATILLVVQLSSFSAERQKLPDGLNTGGVPVSGLSHAQAQAYVEQSYGVPVIATYLNQEIRLDPSQVDLRVNSDAMLSRADELRTEGTFWLGFWDFLWLRPEKAYSIDLEVSYSEDLLRAWLADVAIRYDRPPQPARPIVANLSFEAGQPGYTLDQEASFKLIDAALRRPVDRTVQLVVEQNEAPRPDLNTLQSMIVQYLVNEKFRGVASIYVIDLQTGDEMELNVDLRQGNPNYLSCEVAYASTSTMKIPIMVNFFRYLDWEPKPGTDDYKNLTETMILSGNDSANTMLLKIGGGFGATGNLKSYMYTGTEQVTSSMRHLGLSNTFIVAPYGDEADPIYYSTPAREAARTGTCVNTIPDPYMQTTVRDLAMMLDMIYQCAEFGGGGLVTAYPAEVTQSECQMMIDLMEQNKDGQIIMAGVPENTPVAHKHGWTFDTHGDSGIVFTPGGDYVLSMFLWADTEWLNIQVSFPLMEGISAVTFNYFNPDLVDMPRLGLGSSLGGDSN